MAEELQQPSRWRLDIQCASGLLLGALVVFQCARLPSAGLLGATALAGLLLLTLRPIPRWFGWLLLGGAWTAWQGGLALEAWLPGEHDGRDVPLQVEIIGLPETFEGGIRFDARLLSSADARILRSGARLRLAWYRPQPPDLRPGEQWEFTARLRRPHGLVNPGGFDFERYALQQGLVATGYVREAPAPRLLERAASLDGLRYAIAESLRATAPASSERFLRGLAIGDTRGLDDQDWAVLRATGLSHLLAISGLHIGLVAGFGALFARAGYYLRPRWGLRLPRPLAMSFAALLAAGAYSALAGFGLPTVRTLLMLAVALGAILLRRRASVPQALALAAIAVAAFDPLGLLSPGFWLSFAGVAWLLLCVADERSLRGWLRQLLRAQVVLAIGLLPLGVMLFGQTSLVGILLNLVAVPWVNLVVVPLTLAGTALLPWQAASSALLALAGACMQALWQLSGWAATLPWAEWRWADPERVDLLLAALGTVLLLLPRPLPGKAAGLFAMLVLLWPGRERLPQGDFELLVLDVGQGLSVLVRTRERSLLFDTGASLRSGRDLGELAVLPALQGLGIGRLDRLVLSHGDSDHAGGAGTLLAAFHGLDTLTGEPARLRVGRACSAGERWQWDGVVFSWLHPPEHFPELGNRSSCVLRIQGRHGSALLPGDIDADVERMLLRHPETLRADWLLAPHHGSRSSSSVQFVRAVAATDVVFAVGAHNRFGHPAPAVVQRYRQQGARVYSTALEGALRMRWIGPGQSETVGWRELQPRFWRAAAVDEASGGHGLPADPG